jgi:hypothetical protein
MVPIDGIDDPYTSLIALSDAFALLAEWNGVWMTNDVPELAWHQYNYIMQMSAPHIFVSGGAALPINFPKAE